MANFDGKASTDRYEPHMTCPKCRQKTVRYTGSDVDHGNPFTPAADTEVTHYYACASCDHSFERYA